MVSLPIMKRIRNIPKKECGTCGGMRVICFDSGDIQIQCTVCHGKGEVTDYEALEILKAKQLEKSV